MYMDTKNCNGQFGEAHHHIPVGSSNKSSKSKGKFQKFLKPFLRMLSGGKTTKQRSEIQISHPNNVNLNNVQETSELEDVIRKVVNEEEFLKMYYEQDPFGEEPYPARHSYGEFTEYYNQQEFAFYDQCCQVEPAVEETVVPVHYIRTDAGTFFWTTAQNRIDDDLMKPMECSSFNQTPETQWHSHAMMY